MSRTRARNRKNKKNKAESKAVAKEVTPQKQTPAAGVDTESKGPNLAAFTEAIGNLSTHAAAQKELREAQAALDKSKQGLDEFISKVDALVASAAPVSDDKDVQLLLSKFPVTLGYFKKFAGTTYSPLAQGARTSAIEYRVIELTTLATSINSQRNNVLVPSIELLDAAIKSALLRAELDKAKANLNTSKQDLDKVILEAKSIIRKATPVKDKKEVESLFSQAQKTLAELEDLSKITFPDLGPRFEAKETQARVTELQEHSSKIKGTAPPLILAVILNQLNIAAENQLKITARAEEKIALAAVYASKEGLTELLNNASALIAKAEPVKEEKEVDALFTAAQKAVGELKSFLESKYDPLPGYDTSSSIRARAAVLTILAEDINSNKSNLAPTLASLSQATKKSLISMDDAAAVVNTYKSSSSWLRMIFSEFRSPAIRELRLLTQKNSSSILPAAGESKSPQNPVADLKKAAVLAGLDKDKTLIALNGEKNSITRSSLFKRAIIEDIKLENVSSNTDKVIIQLAQKFRG